MKEFTIPLLTEQDIDCRVQSVSKSKNGKVGAVLLLYKDARVDMRILDLVFGPGNWQRTHEVINENLFCTIEICDLVIVDRNGNVRFNTNGYTPAPRASQNAPQARGERTTRQAPQSAPQAQNGGQTVGPVCPVCGGPISSAEQQYSMKKYGREMCRACQRNA